MKTCRTCRKEFDPNAELVSPAAQLGAFFAEEEFGDAGELCPDCLASRGQLSMMHFREFD